MVALLAQQIPIEEATSLAEAIDRMSVISQLVFLAVGLLVIVGLLIVALMWALRASSKASTEDNTSQQNIIKLFSDALVSFNTAISYHEKQRIEMSKHITDLIERDSTSREDHQAILIRVGYEGKKTRAFVRKELTEQLERIQDGRQERTDTDN